MNPLVAKIRRALKIDNPTVDESNLHLITAFPAVIREDVTRVLAGLPFDAHSSRMSSYAVKVKSEPLTIPYRVYHDVSQIRSKQLSSRQNEVLQCILTRHRDGLVRQQALQCVVCSRAFWVPAYVVQLAGEYVVEILSVIERNLDSLDREIYVTFLNDNREFLSATMQRIESYWDCYYKDLKRGDYPGFHILDYLRELADEGK